MINGLPDEILFNTQRSIAALGGGVTGMAVTATLFVSPNGDNSDGQNWDTAYTTIQTALDAASTDADDCTLILISPHATNYDINTTGDPTWTGNYILRGSERVWAKIKNNHASATSIMKFTGKVSLSNITPDCGTGSNNGVIITGSNTKNAVLSNVYFECEKVTGAQTALELSGGTEYIQMSNVMFHGVQSYTRGMLLDNCKLSNFDKVDFHDCATGIQFTNTSPSNIFSFLLFHVCTLGLDIDSGNTQFFHEVAFGGCTADIDDEVGNHAWINIRGSFPITILPNNFTGTAVNTGDGADTWSSLVTVYTNAGAAPFRVVAVHTAPGTNEYYRLQFTVDDGTTYYDDLLFDVKRREGGAHPSGTEYIFNKGTVIKARSKSVSAGIDTLNVWLEIQEL